MYPAFGIYLLNAGNFELQISHFVIFPPCEELVPIRHIWQIWNLRTVNFDNYLGSDVENWYQIFTNVKNLYQILTHVNESVLDPHSCEKLVPNHHIVEMLLSHHICQWQNCEQLKSVAKCGRFGGTVSMWGIRMYAIWNLTSCVFFTKCEISIGTKYVTYWYQFSTCFEALVRILHSVKFMKCEICGSTWQTANKSKLYYII